MDRPGVWSRLKAFTRGERDAETLYAYKRAGASVHEQLDAAERRRFGMATGGVSPFALSPQVGLELACTWNAFALQTLGDHMLRADEAADPHSVGFVPPVTYDQVHAYYQDVQRWLAHASRATHDDLFRLPPGTLPASLPDWSPVEPCPRPHLDAMMAALDAMRLHAEAAMHELERATPPADAAPLARLRGLYAEAVAAATYVRGMYAPGASQDLHEQIEERAKRAVEGLYRVGQLIGYPALMQVAALPAPAPVPLGRPGAAAAPRPMSAPQPARRAALPGDPTFDPWVMTDPNSVDGLRRDPKARAVIMDMWTLDPDPRASLALWEDIQAALTRGDVAYARHPDGTMVGYYFCTPWAAIYEARRPVVIGDTPVQRGGRFTIECAAEGVRIGYPFKREVVLGNFRPTQMDYCDPDAPPPHDE